jgi:hypothetical protein
MHYYYYYSYLRLNSLEWHSLSRSRNVCALFFFSFLFRTSQQLGLFDSIPFVRCDVNILLQLWPPPPLPLRPPWEYVQKSSSSWKLPRSCWDSGPFRFRDALFWTMGAVAEGVGSSSSRLASTVSLFFLFFFLSFFFRLLLRRSSAWWDSIQ